MENKPIIEVRDIVKSFPSGNDVLVVLKKLNFLVHKGEYVSITGRSGSGKSTLLYLMGLLDDPTAGEIYVDGEQTNTLSNDKKTWLRLKSLGYIFQDYALVPELNSVENVAAPLLMLGMNRESAFLKAQAALDKIGLGARYGNLPSQLSGGEQQRVAIARAIAHDPKILFADEPTANLDFETSNIVLNTFDELHKEGQTIIMVTHEREFAERTDRIVHLSDGVITQDEKTERARHNMR